MENCFISKKEIAKEISLEELNNYNLILPVKRSTPRKQLDYTCANVGVELKPFMTIETTEMLIDSVKKEMGVGYVLRQAVIKEIKEKELFELKIKEKLPTLTLNVVYVNEYLTNIPRTFMNKIENEYKEYMR